MKGLVDSGASIIVGNSDWGKSIKEKIGKADCKDLSEMPDLTITI